MVQTWLIHNPLLRWGFVHPVGGIIAVVILVVLFGGLVRAIAQLTEQLWVRLLQLPMRAVKWVLVPLLQLKPRTADKPQALIASNPDLEPQIGEIMVRLEHLQQEQTLLLQDIKTLLSNQSKTTYTNSGKLHYSSDPPQPPLKRGENGLSPPF
jgi:CBS domain containing-hemolysin-like protein